MSWQDAPLLEAEPTGWQVAPVVEYADTEERDAIAKRLRVDEAIHDDPGLAISGRIPVDKTDYANFPIDRTNNANPFAVFGEWWGNADDRNPTFRGETIKLTNHERMQAADKYVRQQGLDATKEFVRKTPFARDIFFTLESSQVAAAAERIVQDKGTSADYLATAMFFEDQRRLKERTETVLGNTFEIASMLPAYAGEFAATGGAYSGTSKFVTRNLVKLAGAGAGKNVAKRLAIEGAGWAAGTLAQTTINPQMYAKATADRMIPTLGLRPDEAGQLRVVIEKPGEGFLEALPKGFLDTYIEIGSERSGGLLGRGASAGWRALPKAVREMVETSLKASAVSRWLKLHPGSTVSEFIRLRKAIGWNGILGEMFEERGGETARGLTISDDFGTTGDLLTGKFGKAGKQLVAEGLAFLAFPLVERGASAIREDLQGPNLDRSTSTRLDDFKREYPLTPKGIAGWVEANPEAASKLAEIERPSRQQWSQLGPNVKAPERYREDFARAVRDHLAGGIAPQATETAQEQAPAAAEQAKAPILPEATEDGSTLGPGTTAEQLPTEGRRTQTDEWRGKYAELGKNGYLKLIKTKSTESINNRLREAQEESANSNDIVDIEDLSMEAAFLEEEINRRRRSQTQPAEQIDIDSLDDFELDPYLNTLPQAPQNARPQAVPEVVQPGPAAPAGQPQAQPGQLQPVAPGVELGPVQTTQQTPPPYVPQPVANPVTLSQSGPVQTVGEMLGSSRADGWQEKVDWLDKQKAPDWQYRLILSTGSKGTLKRGETWRDRVLSFIAKARELDAGNIEPTQEPRSQPQEQPNAPQKRQEQQGSQLQRQGANEVRPSAEAGGGHRAQEGGQVSGEVATYDMIDYNKTGQLTKTTTLPRAEAQKQLRARQTIFEKLLECLG